MARETPAAEAAEDDVDKADEALEELSDDADAAEEADDADDVDAAEEADEDEVDFAPMDPNVRMMMNVRTTEINEEPRMDRASLPVVFLSIKAPQERPYGQYLPDRKSTDFLPPIPCGNSEKAGTSKTGTLILDGIAVDRAYPVIIDHLRRWGNMPCR